MFKEEKKQTTFTDKAVQAVPTMVDQYIETREDEINATFYSPGKM